jgi:S-adenosylmethionine:tRNA ribosyltransferase-isomerase
VQDLPSLLPAGALLVVNDTRVIPARLQAKKPTGGRVELLLVEPLGDGVWRCLGGASKPIRPGPLALEPASEASRLRRACGEEDARQNVEVEVLRVEGEFVDVRFPGDPTAHAAVPLPPYIDRAPEAADAERYQTVWASVPGAVAAPTAGLHFTPELLAALEVRGIGRAAITLHVGPGTFAPLRSDEIAPDADLHGERFSVPEATARAIDEARRAGRLVVAVGTTVVRTLESAALDDGRVRAGDGRTRLFIKPGHRFRAVDALVTNFHLPRSSLLMLVCAFAGKERVLAAYREAVAAGYRFFSYGDCMYIG